MEKEELAELFKSNPLNEVTRKDRRALLGISVIGIIIVKGNIMPAKLTALGIEFGKTDQNFLLLVIVLITLYFLFAFASYASSDFLEFKINVEKLLRKLELLKEEKKRVVERLDIDKPIRYLYLSLVVFLFRGMFEFFFPIILAVYSMTLLWNAYFSAN